MLNVPRRACPAKEQSTRHACPAKHAKQLAFEALELRNLLTGQTDWVSANPDQTALVYTPDEFGNRIPDFSTAGFRNGSHDIPDVPVRFVVPADGPDRRWLTPNRTWASLWLRFDARGRPRLRVGRPPPRE